MADWFKLHENWFSEPRLQWAIKQQASVVQVWLWALTECCRTKSDTIGLHDEDYEMIGIQQLLNLSPGFFNEGMNLLEKIKYIQIDRDKKTLKVLKWNDFQSDYLRKKGWRESDKVRQDPTKSDSVVLEERRIDKKRKEKKAFNSFVIPKAEEVRAYAKTIEYDLNAETFIDYYIANGWMVGKQKMRDWQAAVRTWKSRRDEKLKSSTAAPVYQPRPSGEAFLK